MNQLAIAPVVVALTTAILTLVLRRSTRVVAGVSLLGSGAYAVAVGLLFRRVATAGPIAYQLSAWRAPFGITIVADALSTVMLVLTAVVTFGAIAFTVRTVDRYGQRLSFHALFHLMVLGITGSFLTGDLFNLFVWFEVMLMASYALVVFYSGPEHTRAGVTYVVLNLIGSAVMLLAIGGLYGLTGTLNMADLARRLSSPEAYGIAPTPVLGVSALLFSVFALKAGLVPFQFWVPGAYRAAPSPVTAVLAGVVKKVGVYAIIRLYFTVFAAAPLAVSLPGIAGGSVLGFFGPVLFAMATASVLLGGLWAVDRPDLDGLLAYSSIAQVGFIVLPLAIAATGSPALRHLGVAAAIVYIVNHGVAKGMLFLISGEIARGMGSDRFRDLGGLAESMPALSAMFLVGGLSLIGIPPLLGFFGKLYVFDVAVRGGSVLAVSVALAGAILSIAYVSRAWNRAFWGPPADAIAAVDRNWPQLVTVLGFTAVILALGIGFESLVRAATAGATAALDTGGYVDAVLGGAR